MRRDRSDATSAGAVEVRRRHVRGVENGGEPAVWLSLLRLAMSARARVRVDADASRERQPRHGWPALMARHVCPACGHPTAAYAGCPAGASGSIYARGGNACALVQRGATSDRRGTANRVAFETNEKLRKLIEVRVLGRMTGG